MKQRTFILNLKKTYQGTTQTVNSSLPKHVKDEPLLANSNTTHKEQQHSAERERTDQLQKCIDHVTAQDNTKPKKHTSKGVIVQTLSFSADENTQILSISHPLVNYNPHTEDQQLTFYMFITKYPSYKSWPVPR